MAKFDFKNSEEISIITQIAQSYPAGKQRADFYKGLKTLLDGIQGLDPESIQQISDYFGEKDLEERRD